MLEANKSISVASSEKGVADLYGSFVIFARRQFPTILFVFLAVMSLAAAYLFTTPPSYTAQALMIIDTHRPQLFQQQSATSDFGIDSAMVGSQVEILKSENIALAVIKNLQLTEDQEFAGPNGGLFGTLIETVSSWFGTGDPRSEFALARRAVDSFASGLAVRRSGLTYIIDISFRSHSPEKAAKVANAVADAYILDQLESKFQATRRAGQWLQDRIKELREQASIAERAVVEFKTKNDIVDAGGGRLINEQRLAELNSQLVISRAQTSDARARLDRIEAILRSDELNATVDPTVTDTLKNEVMTKLRSQYLELATREADWSRRYGSNHLAAVNLRNQMREIRNSIRNELERVAETYKSDFEIATQRQDSIEKELQQTVAESQVTNKAQIALHELESSAQTYRALYDNFLQRYMESVQQQSFPITEARVITPATPPLHKSHPQTLLILALAGIGGSILALGAARLRDLADRVFRTSGQVEELLQTRCLTVLPSLADAGKKHRVPAKKRGVVPVAERTIVRNGGLLWHVVDSPLSQFAEGVRSIKMAIDLNGTPRSTKVIGVTSAVPNEGKSTIACALAQLASHGGARAVLVDCDLRKPSLTRQLTPTAECGLLDVISDAVPLERALWRDPSTGLTFLPGAGKHRALHSSEILASDPVKGLFEGLRQRFDYVVVDLSPIAPVVDVRATVQFIDGYVFVAEWGRTRVEIVEHALEDARGIYESTIGVVLNKADLAMLNRYDGYRGHGYYNRYYSRYGYGG